jgi:hypothetical protein
MANCLTCEQSVIFMVFLAITSTGLADAFRAASAEDAVWCGSDAIAEADPLSAFPPSLSRFIYALGDRVLIADALRTVEEHHPGQTIWVEAVRSA